MEESGFEESGSQILYPKTITLSRIPELPYPKLDHYGQFIPALLYPRLLYPKSLYSTKPKSNTYFIPAVSLSLRYFIQGDFIPSQFIPTNQNQIANFP